MAIDQRDITSQLRMMDDRALQQYAAMHKSDPYVFPLAFQESQNRQKVRMSGQAQMAGQEMPKVNDAALMAMTPQAAPQQAPQTQGISNLPAPNMQRMADGGIAGYEDDQEGMATGGMGGMFNFAQQSEPVVRMSGGGSTHFTSDGIAYPARLTTPDIYPSGQSKTKQDDDGSVVDEFKGVDDQIAANLENQRLMGAFDDYSIPVPKKVEPKKGSKTAKKLEEEAKKEAKKEEPVKPKVELPPLQTYKASTPADIRRTADEMAKPDLEEIQSSYKPFAEQFAQDRTRIEGREKNNLSDSLIRAGLGIMAGKSQFAAQNIGEGGLQGLNAYQEGIRTNDAARKALTQSEMLMAQAQRAERQGARKDAVQLTNQAEQAKQTAVQLSNTARQIMGTEEFQKGQTEVSLRNAATAEQNAVTSGRMADSSMVAARAAETRANLLGGTSGDKHMAALVKVQNALNADKEYQQAAKDARFQGKVGDNARATMERKKREVYRLLAPELLQSLDAGKTAPPAGSGGGTNLPPLSSFNM
jgi:hypothetical protein